MAYMTTEDVHEYINGVCFKTGPPGKVGAETEWLVTDLASPTAPVTIERLSALLEACGPPPAGSRITFEPGGQIELSSVALPGPARTHEALETDLRHVGKALAEDGLALAETALDPVRPPVRQLRLPRYTAMERFFTEHRQPSGRTMMCSTASLQVCLDTGADLDDARERWSLLHRLGPVLVASFANSTVWRGRPTGWKSTRWAIWAATDSGRTRPVLEPGTGPDPATAWAEYALAARVMAVPEFPGGGGSWIADPGITLAEWVEGRGPRPVTTADLEFHLSTLFPPLRPRGCGETTHGPAPSLVVDRAERGGTSHGANENCFRLPFVEFPNTPHGVPLCPNGPPTTPPRPPRSATRSPSAGTTAETSCPRQIGAGGPARAEPAPYGSSPSSSPRWPSDTPGCPTS
ncbi:glutamate-cysteine ligase family protein [Nocardiopsis alba]|uniref:glutamate-cysteine ligase family protein n=1 Tax=Nocardiopsis alba TaxID=53437 RepID=UPI0033D5F177